MLKTHSKEFVHPNLTKRLYMYRFKMYSEIVFDFTKISYCTGMCRFHEKIGVEKN